MASDYCYGIEMKRAMERHEREETIVIPVILRPVYWQGTPFGKLQALPTDGKPLKSTAWQYPDEAFLDIAEGIRRAVEVMRTRASVEFSSTQAEPVTVRGKGEDIKGGKKSSTTHQDTQIVNFPHTLAMRTKSPLSQVSVLRLNHRWSMLVIFFCFLLVLGGFGGGTWLSIERQHQLVMATAAARVDAKATVSTYATAAASTYATATDKGVQFGFDEAHTHWNRYERVINTANVPHLTKMWSYLTVGGIGSSPAVANGMVYIGSNDHRLYAFDATCRSACTPLWSYLTAGYISSSPAVANGMVYVGSFDYAFYAFDATCRSVCKPLWFYPTATYFRSSPTVANNVVYIGSDDHRLYAFDATCRSACTPLWSYFTDGYVESEPAVANGIVYVGSDGGSLYAFGLPS